MRVKLAARGAGRWRISAGFRSKFGLTLTEVLEAFEYLKQRDMADCLQLVHFHLGSQITNIRNIKDALTEAARVYVELHRVGAGAQVHRRRRRPGHRLRRLADRLRVVASTTRCRNTPTTSSSASRASATRPACRTRRSSPRSGRAVVAYHSLLVFDVLGVVQLRPLHGAAGDSRPTPRSRSRDLFAIYRDLNKKNFLESYHDAVQAMDEALNLFNLGAPVDRAAGAGRAAVLGRRAARSCGSSANSTTCPEELQGLEDDAVGHLLLQLLGLPVDARLAGRSSSSSRSCRSTGSTSRRRGGRSSATSPATRTARSTSSSTCATCATRWNCTRSTAEPYYLGAFLLGAYQEILGDLHNLFGDTNAVHVSLDEDGDVEPRRGHQGRHGAARCCTTCSTRPTKLTRPDAQGRRARRAAGQDLAGRESRQFLRFYETGLEGYTYLEEPSA